MWRSPRQLPRLAEAASNLSDPSVGSHRFGNGFEPGDGIRKRLEVDADRVDRRKAQILLLCAAAPLRRSTSSVRPSASAEASRPKAWTRRYIGLERTAASVPLTPEANSSSTERLSSGS